MSPQYRFCAKTWTGETINDYLRASSRIEALEVLDSRNLVTLDLKEQPEYRHNLQEKASKALRSIGYRPYSNRDLMIFCRQFAIMLKSGIAVLYSLNILSEQTNVAALQKNIRSTAREVEQGSSLSAALQNQEEGFPAIMIHMVAAGEESGRLDMIMDKMADHFEKQHDFAEKIRSATLYPAFIIGVSIVVMVVMILFVLPQFTQIFASMGMEMPFYTNLLITGAELIRQYWHLLLGLIIITMVSLIAYKKTDKGRLQFDLLRLRLPLIGKIYSQTMAARFARNLSTMLASGVTLHNSLVLVSKIIDNAAITNSIRSLNDALNRGETMADSLNNNSYFPSLLSEMVRIGEESGTLDQTLHSSAVFYEREVSYVVNRLSTILEPALLLIVGVFIGLLVFSILSPMYEVFQMI